MLLKAVLSFLFFFFFSSRRRHTRLQGDWSSDVCSSDLADADSPRAPQGESASASGGCSAVSSRHLPPADGSPRGRVPKAALFTPGQSVTVRPSAAARAAASTTTSACTPALASTGLGVPPAHASRNSARSEEHTSELQSPCN